MDQVSRSLLDHLPTLFTGEHPCDRRIWGGAIYDAVQGFAFGACHADYGAGQARPFFKDVTGAGVHFCTFQYRHSV